MSAITFELIIASKNLLLLTIVITVGLFGHIPVLQLGQEYASSLLLDISTRFDAQLQDSNNSLPISQNIITGLLICDPPLNFPRTVELSRQDYVNWARALHIEDVWTATPHSPEEVLLIANWAERNGYRLRARGYMHNWSPITLTPNEPRCGKLVLIDTTKYLTGMKMVTSESGAAAVQVETGTSLENLLTFLEDNDFGIASHPATGDISIGGILAVGGHGAGQSYGSLSNLVTSLRACVWNEADRAFEIKSFNRTEPETKYLLVNLGRIFLTEVTLRVRPKFNMRCISRADIPVSELFAHPTTALSASRTFAKLLEESTSVEIIWFPFTLKPWLKIWSVEPIKPISSTHVSEPYNYPLTDRFPKQLCELFQRKITTGWQSWTPFFGEIGYQVGRAETSDIWGTSKNLLLYVKSTTLRVNELGYALITNRHNVQLVISQFTAFYDRLLEQYAKEGLFPVNMPLHIRLSGLDGDGPEGAGISNAEPPALSVLKPIANRPDLDTAVWIASLTFPNTPNSTDFMRHLEFFLTTNYPTSLAIARPEWSKSWAFTEQSAWTQDEMIRYTIPKLYNARDWNLAISSFNKFDPSRVFTNSFIDKLLR